MRRSAWILTVVVVVALLLAVFGSVVVEVTVAVLLTGLVVEEESTRTTRVTLALALAATVPRLQERLVVPVQVPCEGMAEI